MVYGMKMLGGQALRVCLILFLSGFGGTGEDPPMAQLIRKDVMQQVKETERPAPWRLLREVDLSALRGEYEPFTFAVYCRDGCPSLQVSLSNLKRTDGGPGEIDQNHIEMARLSRGTTPLSVEDWILEPIGESGLQILKGQSVRIWVTLHVPDAALPGKYQGTLTVTQRNQSPSEVPVVVKVLHQALEDPSGVQFALLYTVSPFGRHYKPEKYQRLEKSVLTFYRELRAHGMTCVSPKCSDWPYRRGHIEGLKAEVSLATRAGLTGPVLWYMSALINGAKGGERYAHYDGKCDNWDESRDLANLREIVTQTRETQIREAWPEVVFITVDEPGTDTEDRRINDLRMEILEKSLKVVKEMGGQGASTIIEPVDDRHNKAPFSRVPNELRHSWDRVRPYCPIRIYGYGYPQGETSLYAEKKDALSRGHQIWFYNNKAIMRDDRYVGRTYFGIWGWKVGAQGLTAWTYPGARTVQWEIVREGIDDFKYLKLIERLSREPDTKPEVREQAERFLKRVQESLPLDKDGYVKDWKPKMDPSEFHRRAGEALERLSLRDHQETP